MHNKHPRFLRAHVAYVPLACASEYVVPLSGRPRLFKVVKVSFADGSQFKRKRHGCARGTSASCEGNNTSARARQWGSQCPWFPMQLTSTIFVLRCWTTLLRNNKRIFKNNTRNTAHTTPKQAQTADAI